MMLEFGEVVAVHSVVRRRDGCDLPLRLFPPPPLAATVILVVRIPVVCVAALVPTRIATVLLATDAFAPLIALFGVATIVALPDPAGVRAAILVVPRVASTTASRYYYYYYNCCCCGCHT